MSGREDAALARLARDRGDDDAWRVLWVWLWPFMVAVCARLLHDPIAAKECAQSAMIRIATYAPFSELGNPVDMRAYARTVCRHVVYSEWKRQQHTPFVPLETPGASISDPLDPEESVDAVQLLEVILSHLSAFEQHLVRLTVAGHTLDEIAATFGISYEAAGTRVHRVRTTIRKWLNDNGL